MKWFLLLFILIVGCLNTAEPPQRFIPDKCLFGSGISCYYQDMYISSIDNNTFQARLQNNFGASVNVYGSAGRFNSSILSDELTAGCSLCMMKRGSGKTCCSPLSFGKGDPEDIMARKNCDPESESPTIFYLQNSTHLLPAESAFGWKEGEGLILAMGCDQGHDLPKGEKIKLKIIFKYYPNTSTKVYSKEIEGEVYIRVDGQASPAPPKSTSKGNYAVLIIALVVLISIPSFFIYFIMKDRKRNP